MNLSYTKTSCDKPPPQKDSPLQKFLIIWNLSEVKKITFERLLREKTAWAERFHIMSDKGTVLENRNQVKHAM